MSNQWKATINIQIVQDKRLRDWKSGKAQIMADMPRPAINADLDPAAGRTDESAEALLGWFDTYA